MSRAARAAALALLAGPAALAFFSGGYFDEARQWAALGALALVAVGALVAPPPERAPGWVAAGALLALAGWVALSATWAPLVGPAIADAQRVLLYAAALTAGLLLLRGDARRLVEPVLLAGIVVVVGYGLSERLLPSLIDLQASRTALGRLEQPLTYWNAMGALSAMGVVLAAALAARPERPRALRAAAAAASVPLSVGVVLAFSRASIAVALVGLALLAWLAPSRAQLRLVVAVLSAGAVAGAAASAFDGVRALEGGARQAQGAGVALVIAALAGALAWLAARDPGREQARRPAWVAGAAVVALVAALAVAIATERGPTAPAEGATVARLVSSDSNRYAYWRVARDMAAEAPLRGAGSGAFRVEWRRERTVADRASDAHSLYLETLAELGLVGLALLAVAVAAVVLGARATLRAEGAPVAGAVAALAVWALHAGVDWDWEMPALTLVAVLLAARLSGAARTPRP